MRLSIAPSPSASNSSTAPNSLSNSSTSAADSTHPSNALNNNPDTVQNSGSPSETDVQTGNKHIVLDQKNGNGSPSVEDETSEHKLSVNNNSDDKILNDLRAASNNHMSEKYSKNNDELGKQSQSQDSNIYPEERTRKTSISKSALSVSSKKPKQESDYGSSFYNRKWQYNENSNDTSTNGQASANTGTEQEEIYYDDSVNSGYSNYTNSDLVLSHFGPNVDAVKHLESLTGTYPGGVKIPTTAFPAVVLNADTHTDMKDKSIDLSFDKSLSQKESTSITSFPSELPDTTKRKSSIEKSNGEKLADSSSHAIRRQRSRSNDNESPSVPDIGQGQLMDPLEEPSSVEISSNDRGILTNAQDSVIPLLDPQPDLIPESARRRPAPPKPPQKPPNLLAGITSSAAAPQHASPPQGIPVASVAPAVRIPPSVAPRTSHSSNVSVTHASQAPTTMTIATTSIPPPPSERSASLEMRDLSLQHSSSTQKRISQPRPVPPPRSSSIKSSDGDQDGSQSGDERQKTHNGAMREESPVAGERRASGSQVQVKHPTYESQVSQGSNNAIDIHVTVTVKPLAPGTLADLKQQRALNRTSHTSPAIDSGSISSSTLGRSGGTMVDVNTNRQEPLNIAGEDNLAFEKNSIGGDGGSAALAPERVSRVVSSDTVAYRAPESPLPPRKYHGEPSVDYTSAPSDSRSCCVIL